MNRVGEGFPEEDDGLRWRVGEREITGEELKRFGNVVLVRFSVVFVDLCWEIAERYLVVSVVVWSLLKLGGVGFHSESEL